MKRWLFRIGIGAVATLATSLLLALDFVSSFQRSLPSYRGTVAVAGLAQPAQILRDRYAIPHIVAGSFEDAAFALGYAHAQDRLWQMELSRRFIQGRLAELFGGPTVDTDIMMRTMGLYETAKDAVQHLAPESQGVLVAYSNGVNAFLASDKRRRPIEFALAGDTPEPWTPADSIAVLKGMALQLSGNAFGEAARAQLLPVLGHRGVEDFFPPFSEAPLPGYLDEVYATTRTGEAYGVPDTTASDNWVVDGAHSVTGKPLLANDPHLGFTMPSVWYLAHLSFAGEDVVGGTLAGIPAIVVGRNRHVAWGMTNTGPDTEDLYLERINPDNSRQYQTPVGFAGFETRSEIIKVRFGADRRVVIRKTRHGPVMSDAKGTSFADAAPEGYALAMAWTALLPDDTSMDSLLAIGRAKDANDLRAAGRSFVAPMQNIVYADDSDGSGHIGLALPGRVPIRAQSNDSLGLVPAPGWEGRYDWGGYIPPDAMVSIVDPPAGRIATANNKTAPENYPHTLTREWESNYRYDRIETLLTAGVAHDFNGREILNTHSRTPGSLTSKHSVETFKQIQLDVVDIYALALKERLIEVGRLHRVTDGSYQVPEMFDFRTDGPLDSPEANAAAGLIEQWDGSMRANRKEPFIFAAWARALAKRIYADELGPNFPAYWGYREQFTLRVLDNIDGEGRWCDDKGTPEVETCRDMIRLALKDALPEMKLRYGGEPPNWMGRPTWGDLHKAVHVHRPFGSFPFIGPFFNREIEMDGGPFTLLRADNRMASVRPYAAIHGAGYRGIYDLADPDQSRYIISTGQSGNVFSPHYDDLLELWAKGEYLAIPTDPTAVAGATVDRLDLQPMKAAGAAPTSTNP